jgi:hypothetical protein
VTKKQLAKARALAREVLKAHKPREQNGELYCDGCPDEDWGHNDFGPASAPCELYVLAQALVEGKARRGR